MKTWPWLMSFFLAWGAYVHAQTEPVVPADDRKEPKTLSKVVTAAQPAKPAADLLDDGSALKPETSYNPPPPLVLPTPEVSAIKTSPIQKTVDQLEVRGYLAAPGKKAPQAALLIVPEWWGLNAQIKGEAETWARQGFKVLAVDLYGGQVAKNRGEAARLMGQLKPETVLPQLKAALSLLTANPATTATATTTTLPVAVMGFGIGAAYAQRLAAEDPRPQALVIMQGELLKEPAELARIKAPTLGIFAGRDAWITPDKIEAFKKAMSGAKLPPQTYAFEADPGFMFNPGDPTAKGYAETARTRVFDFLKRELGM
jgi:carboxymethylenebutenolidase